ncbi:MAG: cold shock domain-containing protein [Gammaproteobacteria bacterium]
MAKGTVKWFNNAKGYGFIIADEGGDDLFVHYSYVNMEGYRTLKAGQRVEYDTQEAPKGLHAVNIRTEMPSDQPDLTTDDTVQNTEASKNIVVEEKTHSPTEPA